MVSMNEFELNALGQVSITEEQPPCSDLFNDLK